MACGAIPVLPSMGGVAEYAVDGRNAMLVDTEDEDAVLGAVASLAADSDRRERLRTAGIEPARRFTVTRAAASQYACFAARHAALERSR